MNLANPKLYGLIGLVLVAMPMLFFFFAGLPYTGGGKTRFANGTTISYSGTVWEGAFNPSMLIFIFLAVVAMFGCYHNKRLAWIGSVLLLILSLVAGFTVGLFAVPGTIFLLVGAFLKSYNSKTET